MKRTIFTISMLAFSTLGLAQVGINTENPQNTFHIDGGKNNNISGMPTELQQLDDFIVTESGKVGIGMDNPIAQLQTTGNMILGTAESSNGASGFSPIIRNNTTGELKIATSNSGNTYIFNNVTYQIDNVEGDFINDFNTNIDATQYTVIITGSSFLTSSGDGLVNQSTGIFAPKNIYAFPNNGTWHLTADYRGANTSDGLNGSWTINCMILNNTFINSLGTVTADLSGFQNGSTVSPTGL